MSEGLLKINLQDLEEEEEDEDYVPQASEIEEYKREKKELKDLKKKKNQEELHQEILQSWIELKKEVREKEMNQINEIRKQTQMLLKDKDLLLQIAQKALRLNEDDKQRKVIFAGQEFIVDSSGEIVGRADEQAYLKEFQLFESKEINQMKFEESKNVKEEIIESKKEEPQEIIIEENNKEEVQEVQEVQEEKVEKVEKVEVVQEVIQQLGQEEKHRLDMKNRFQYLQKVMDKINSKSKSITSIHKSKLDWKSFTKKEKLEKKFEQNRKAGYLDKQNFIAKATEKQKQIQKSTRR
ncbi:bucentaur or craniofacial development protein (macronuclear) [Tetrahymena thermophila SB210]|uniref:Bucentaur or craniofacial development protein n=1 Tax=Tetrahymena thermophila (strain SB210) TaxID=312017 RepID=I7M277_TETTS|nr:bucentaur or craniofacial development protein [Tetrahymena thermophila SB210]EAR99481.1 bucentaur or craniofacial development protein [Tetrahymena thermophila SB210]|eukprot:XP_001019726.1 bucentaur or craniofacial development protein [Tetrahymena thermophila SB210]